MKRKIFYILPLLLMIAALAGICFGSTPISPVQLWQTLTGRGEETLKLILWNIRLPRVLGGILAGMGLAVAGVLLQTVTDNALASPNLIGVNSGAGLAVIGLLTLFPAAGAWLPVGAFLGAFAAVGLILLAAGRLGTTKTGLLLMGIAITTLLNAAISFLSLLDEGVFSQYHHFTLGSLKALRLESLVLPGLLIILSAACAMILSGRLQTLCLGDSAAAALGVRVKGLRIAALACAAACSASVVSFAGLLGFVGLIVPHMARALVGQSPRWRIPTAALLGGILVVLADLLGRTLFAPSELPVGIVMSFIGAPYFLILLLRRKRHASV